MRHRQIFALLLALALLLTGCVPAVGEGSAAPSPTGSISPEASSEITPTSTPAGTDVPPAMTDVPLTPWMEDWELFWKTLEENYPYEGVLYRTTGQTLADIEQKYHIGAEGVSSAEQMLKYLQTVSESFAGIGHFSVFDRDSYTQMYEFCDGRRQKSPKLSYLARRMDNEQSRALYGYRSAEYAPMGTDRSRARLEGSYGNLSFTYYPEQSAAYVEVRSMLNEGEDYERDRALLMDFFQAIEAEGYKHCIIDIRRNGGGYSNYGTQMLIRPNVTGPANTLHYVLVKGGVEVEAYFDVCGIETHPIEELPREELPALTEEDLDGMAGYMTANVGTYESWDYPDTPAFSGRFWLLVGPQVYSSSEWFAITCKDTGFATLVGQTTGGDGIGMDPLVCVLPNSGITYRFSTMCGLNLDGSSNEEVGTAPDIAIPVGKNALEACLEAIEAETD